MSKQQEFKIGDKVRVLEIAGSDSDFGVIQGDIYEVIKSTNTFISIYKWGLSRPVPMFKSQLELVRPTPYQYMLEYHGIDEDTWFNIVLFDGSVSTIGEVRFTNGILYDRANMAVADNMLYKYATVQIVTKSKKELAIEQAEIKLFDAQDKIVIAERELIKARNM